ncbi:hypothetical protein ACWGE0_40100 [Lentzea sp. NPDC054927]
MEPYKLKLLLLLVGLVALFSPLWWWSWRKSRQEVNEHEDALAAFAGNVSGSVADASGDVLPWSAALAPPFMGEHGGALGLLTSAGGPRFDYALEFERNGWRVRVCEASVEVRTVTTAGNTVTHYEHRIEVATSDLVPLKIVIGGGAGRGLFTRWAAEPSRAGESRLWMELRLPELSGHLAYTSDLPEAGAVVNDHVAEWLRTQADEQLFWFIGWEGGIVHTTVHGQIEEESVLRRVDALIGLLDRMPGARPRHPAAV